MQRRVAPAHVIAHVDQTWPDYYQIARREIGVKEVPGLDANERIQEYLATVKLLDYGDETPWCSAFVNWCMAAVGRAHTDSASARSWLTWGVSTKTPREGDVVVFWRGNPASWQGHVAFVVKVVGDQVLAFGGNQGNCVSEKWYPVSRVLGYRTMREMPA